MNHHIAAVLTILSPFVFTYFVLDTALYFRSIVNKEKRYGVIEFLKGKHIEDRINERNEKARI